MNSSDSRQKSKFRTNIGGLFVIGLQSQNYIAISRKNLPTASAFKGSRGPTFIHAKGVTEKEHTIIQEAQNPLQSLLAFPPWKMRKAQPHYMTISEKSSECFRRDCESLHNLQISCLDPCIKWVKVLYLFPAECLQNKWNFIFSGFFLKVRPFYNIFSRLLHRTRNREISRKNLNSSLFSTTQKLIITKFINWD